MRNQRGEVATLTIIVIAFLAAVITPLVLKSNPFDRSADPANRRTASAISGRDIVEITNTVAQSEKPVTVKVDRSVEATAEVTDPKLTLGQKIGRFFGGLGTWAVILLIAACVLIPGFGVGLLAWSRHTWRDAFKNTVAGIRELDDETYQKVVPKLASKQNKRDKQLVDRVKSELH